jgi:diguanylate cyclase (GGDEF)-like protein
MHLPTYWLSLAMATTSLAALATVWRTWRLPSFPGQRSFVLSIVASAWWAGAVAVEHGSAQPEAKIFWAELAWLGIIVAPGAWALFVWNYIHGQYRPASPVLYSALALLAATVWVLALTNDSHHLMYVATVPSGTPPAMTVNYFHGPLYFVLAALFYSATAVSEALLLYEVVHTGPAYRTHYLGLAAAGLLPWFFNVGYATRTITIGTADLTPLSFAAMNMVLYWLVSRRQLFDLLPIAQRILLDAIPDPILVLDGARRITVCNPAAQWLAEPRNLRGMTIAAIPELREALSAIDDAGAVPREVAIGRPARYFDVGQVPLTYAGREVGRLILLREISHRKEAERRLQTAMTELERQLESNVALQRQLREEAIRDALTGLHNRRFFEELAPVMLAEAQRAGAPLAAAMIDVDHFKRLNDSYGHAAGDAVLRAVGAFLRRHMRQSDMVFRIGGEEFLILLPHTGEDQALGFVDQWRAAFVDEAIMHDGTALSATFSAGLALYPADADGIAALLERADRALYQAKQGGRNRTVRWRAEA